VTISCTSAATIRYCLSENTCCDPETSGTTYTSNVVIGAQQGTYCLSFYGESTSSSIESSIVQQSYTISNTLPHLEVSHPQIFYQTTELAGMGHIASDDFGKLNFGVGQVNLKNNDPGPSGLDLDCDEIVTNYVTFPPVTPVILSFFDTLGVSPLSQLDVPFTRTHLEYGDNFITTYMTNNNHPAPLYSCSTTKVTLEDFEFFQGEVAHAEDGTNTVREFSGGLSSYGFFEEETTVYRGPAGTSAEEMDGQRLESGIFSIFY
jgi:hypothetical protein